MLKRISFIMSTIALGGLLLDTTWVLAVDEATRVQHQERAQRLRQQALERATGVRISTPASVPQFYRDFVGNTFQQDLGGGRFVQDFNGRLFLLTFVSFDIPIQNPCEFMIQRQRAKAYRFVRSAGTGFQRQLPPQGPPPPAPDGDPDEPPVNPNNTMQDPGELTGQGSGRFTSYDIPGPEFFGFGGGGPQMPPSVTDDRIRLVFRVEVTCPEDGRVVKRFFWMIETTVPYNNGMPVLGQATSSVRQISSIEYDNADALFGQDHQ